MSKGDGTDINEQIAASIKNFSRLAKDDVARQRLTIDMPEFIRKKAAVISAHLLLPAGARVIDMGCTTGEIAYVLAQLKPRCDITGIDRDAHAIDFARKYYRLPNLSYRVDDLSIPDADDGSIDCIINSNVLHGVYSGAGYDTDEVADLLELQARKLKPGGTMLIRDYIMPPENEYVLLELPDQPSRGRDVAQLSDADLLILFSQLARPLSSGGHEGFFIEEQKPKREGTRLFRLPHKWAVEFLHRKDYRAKWQKEIRNEYTFFTQQDMKREFTRTGMRMTYFAPYWNPWVIKNCFRGRFQLYATDGRPLGYPPTNYFIVAERAGTGQSLALEERRPSQKPVGDLNVRCIRDKKDGAVQELVSRPGEFCDLIPYRITPDNRLAVFVRSAAARPVVNAVARGSDNLDGKRWSGHLVEPMSMSIDRMTSDAKENKRLIFDFLHDIMKLRPKSDDSWYVSDPYFPDPARIEEVIEPVFIEVENPQHTAWPLPASKGWDFVETGTVTELDGSDILLAAQVGLLAEPKLEAYVLELMGRHNIPLPPWVGDDAPQIQPRPVKTRDPEDVLKDAERGDFEEMKSGPTHLKPVKAVFVEEGKVGRGARGLGAHDIEFIVSEDGVENIAVVLPLSRDWDNNLLVALEPQSLSVPNRLGGDGVMLNAPSFTLPSDVHTLDDAKSFIAGKFGVTPDHVLSLGESYFTHVSLTPQRIYPFAVTSLGELKEWRDLDFMMMRKIHRLHGFQYRLNRQTIKLIARTTMLTGEDAGMNAYRDMAHYKYQDRKMFGTDGGGERFASRILGERGSLASMNANVEAKAEAKEAPARRLTHSYTQAKVEVKSAAGLEKGRDINSIARALLHDPDDEPVQKPKPHA